MTICNTFSFSRSNCLKNSCPENLEIIMAKYLCWSLFLKRLVANLVLMNRVRNFAIIFRLSVNFKALLCDIKKDKVSSKQLIRFTFS